MEFEGGVVGRGGIVGRGWGRREGVGPWGGVGLARRAGPCASTYFTAISSISHNYYAFISTNY